MTPADNVSQAAQEIQRSQRSSPTLPRDAGQPASHQSSPGQAPQAAQAQESAAGGATHLELVECLYLAYPTSEADKLDLSPFMRQTVKTQNTSFEIGIADS